MKKTMWGKFCEVYAPKVEKVGEGVKAEDSDRKNLPRFMIKHMYRLRKNIMDWLPSLNDIERAHKQLDQLESKAQELDRREKGCCITPKTHPFLEDWIEGAYCDNCGVEIVRQSKYCPSCGTKLIWEASDD